VLFKLLHSTVQLRKFAAVIMLTFKISNENISDAFICVQLFGSEFGHFATSFLPFHFIKYFSIVSCEQSMASLSDEVTNDRDNKLATFQVRIPPC